MIINCARVQVAQSTELFVIVLDTMQGIDANEMRILSAEHDQAPPPQPHWWNYDSELSRQQQKVPAEAALIVLQWCPSRDACMEECKQEVKPDWIGNDLQMFFTLIQVTEKWMAVAIVAN
ncbi:unnamed protein product [Lota lota]